MINVGSGLKLRAYSQWLLADGSVVEVRLVLIFKECEMLACSVSHALDYQAYRK